MLRWTHLLTAVSLVCGPLTAGQKTASGGANPFRLGCVVPLSGEAATFGDATRNGVELAVEEWNAKGGVLGRKIVVTTADDEGDPAVGAEVYGKLIKVDKVSAIVGPVMSKVALAGAPLCQAQRVPMVSPTATHPKVTQVGTYIFRACFVDPLQGSVGARFAREKLRARKAACFFDGGNDYTTSLADTFAARFKELGGEVVASERHDSDIEVFEEQLTEILELRPDVLYVPDYYHDAARIVQQARELGFKGPILGGDGWDSPRFVEMAGGTVENCYFTNHYVSDDARPEVKAFVKRYKEKFEMEPDALSALGYDAACITLDAVKRAGKDDGTAIRDALKATKLKTICGPVYFDASRNPQKPAVIVAFQEGQIVYHSTVMP